MRRELDTEDKPERDEPPLVGRTENGIYFKTPTIGINRTSYSAIFEIGPGLVRARVYDGRGQCTESAVVRYNRATSRHRPALRLATAQDVLGHMLAYSWVSIEPAVRSRLPSAMPALESLLPPYARTCK